MNWILGIDTSSTDLGVGLFRDEQPVASYSRYLKNSHAEHIAATVAMVLENNSLRAADITHVALARGPGSFTGLRIGFAFVKGFCFAATTRVLPLSSLRILANAARSPGSGVVAAIDARRDDVFWARFASGTHGGVVRQTPDALTPVADFTSALQPGDVVVTDTMGYAQSTVFNFLSGRPNVLPIETYPAQRGLLCAALGAAQAADHAAWKDPIDILPEYLRSFTAPPSSKGQGL